MWQIEFTSSKFAPYLPEDCQSNPGVYGFELAQWLSQQLAERKIITSYPNQEDWGWFLDYSDQNIEVMICCGSTADKNENPQAMGWSVYIQPLLSLRQKWKGITADQIVHFLSQHIVEILEKEGIHPKQA